METGSSGSLKRARSPILLEYALDHQVPSLSRVCQVVPTSREGSPDFSKWVSSDYFGKMVEWLADVNLGKPPSDEEEAQSQFGIGWAGRWQELRLRPIKTLRMMRSKVL